MEKEWRKNINGTRVDRMKSLGVLELIGRHSAQHVRDAVGLHVCVCIYIYKYIYIYMQPITHGRTAVSVWDT